jgi:hypothetical protein
MARRRTKKNNRTLADCGDSNGGRFSSASVFLLVACFLKGVSFRLFVCTFCQNGTSRSPTYRSQWGEKRRNAFTFNNLRARPLAVARALRNTAESRGALPFLAPPRTPRIPIAGRFSPRFLYDCQFNQPHFDRRNIAWQQNRWCLKMMPGRRWRQASKS